MPGPANNGIADEIRALENKLSELRRELLGGQVETVQFDALKFSVGESAFALRLQDVVEVLRMVKWQPLPKAPPDIQGVINCRGVMLPILNLGAVVSDAPVEPRTAVARSTSTPFRRSTNSQGSLVSSR